ncbi:Imm61 family immunity protein [Agromyces sp. H3Y2-19a]|uniref:Imm61 family immunity protein n=1 Tax=Agromyces TaxID=33877 RepID=UPI001E548CE0|nr:MULTISPECIES: Imm61 family immunity protein [Agromyces]MCD5346231.1 TNT antitoxin family protein [Agromyces sp. S2-1-8]MDF0512598.1 Imm61 family immunity protein [Agromyces chromiiresistens]
MDASAERSDPIVDYAADGRVVTFPSADAVLSIGDMEILYEIRAREGGFELTRQARNEVPRLLVSSSEMGLVRKYLLMLLSVHVRSHLRQRPIRFPGSPESLPAGFDLETGEAEQTLRWVSDGEPHAAIFPPGSTAASEAAKFTSVARRTEEEIIASLEHPGGRPLFLIR